MRSYDNVAPKKPSVSVASSSTQPPAQSQSARVSSNGQPASISNKPTEFKIDGNTFKFDTTGFTPITTTPSSSSPYGVAFRAQPTDRGVHVHNNPLYGSANGKCIIYIWGACMISITIITFFDNNFLIY